MDPSFSAQLLEFMDTNTGCKVLSNMDAKDTGEIVHHAQGMPQSKVSDEDCIFFDGSVFLVFFFMLCFDRFR